MIFASWREQSNTGNDKNERVLMHFCRSVDGVCFWPLQYRASYFLWLFCGEFSTSLNNFCIHGVSKATPRTTKRNAFPCIFACRWTACVFCHCNTGVRVFWCSFEVRLERVLGQFCRIFGTRPKTHTRYMNGPWSSSKIAIFITFSCVFDTGKI